MENNNIKPMFKCPVCSSSRINIQIINESKLVKKRKGIIWWLLIGWWFVPIIWFFFFIPKLLIKILGIGSIKQKIVNIEIKKGICQQCGNIFDIKGNNLN